jgi:hypothetical protein
MDLRLKADRAEAGASLIEVALSITLIAIALVPTSRLWLASAQADQAAAHKAEALAVAQRLLEQRVRAVPFAAVSGVAGTDPATGLAYAMDLADVPGMPAGVKRVEIRVSRPTEPDPLIRMVTLTAKEQW